MEQSSGPLNFDKIETILSVKFPYYNRLNLEDKKKFIERTLKFSNDKEFIPRDEKYIMDEMDNIKILISAAAIELTFGLTEYKLEHFSKVVVYPHDYYSLLNRHWHKGETNPMGAIVFSWKDFKEAYNSDHGKMNLGLHEMAHALLFSDKIDDGKDEFFAEYFDKWWAVSGAEFRKLEKHETSFFRDYGGTNQQEFFAVCVECFFEVSAEFKEKHPEIYRQTCILLNQDPSGDYAKITKARELLLENIPGITPGNLVYRTKGRNLMGTVLTSGGIGIYLFFIFATIGGMQAFQNILILGIIALFALFFLVRFIKYKEFYIYNNAFAIGYERHGEDLERMDIIGAPECVSIVFKTIYQPKGPDTKKIELTHIQDGRLTKTSWRYNHIITTQAEALKNAVKEYCEKNCIAFHGTKE